GRRAPAWPALAAGRCFLGHGGAWRAVDSAALHSAAHPADAFAATPARARHALPVAVAASLLERHVLAVGAPGSGKSSLLLLLARQAQLRGECVVVIDPKGSRDLRERLAAGARAAGLAFLDLQLDGTAPATRYDPFRHCRDGAACADRLAVLMADRRDDPFQAFSWGALATLCQVMLEQGERPALGRLLELVPDAGSALLATAAGAAPTAAVTALRALVGHDRSHYGKMTAPLLPVLALLAGAGGGCLLRPPAIGDAAVSLDLWRCRAQSATVYLGLDALAQPRLTAALACLLCDDLARQASASWQQGLRQPALQLLVDEAGEVANEALLRLLGKGREAGVRVTFALQTLSDLEWRLGSEAAARVALGNAGAWFLFRQLDAHSREESEARLGQLPLEQRSHQRSQGRSHGGGRHSASRSVAESRSAACMPRVPAAAFGALQDLECLAQLPDGQLLHLRLPQAEPGAPCGPGSPH
ncbi:MAG: type IV secretion system DNA-binding domain-containing protein, partial [Pseudomonadota bacterium]|nr:type IV secretion system DNA-binding domain-containing protein [Pseudomonadota bacterium]